MFLHMSLLGFLLSPVLFFLGSVAMVSVFSHFKLFTKH